VPGVVDWDGDGVANEGDEWIELYNGSARAVSLAGYTLDLDDGDQGYRFPRGTILRPGAFLVLFRRQTGLPLNDLGGQIRLLDARGRLVESVTYKLLTPDSSQSRDAIGRWHDDYPPSPGAVNLPVRPTSTATADATPASSEPPATP
jgi:hypothetical protein